MRKTSFLLIGAATGVALTIIATLPPIALGEDANPSATNYRALDLFSENQYEQAAAAYQQAIALDPTFTDAMHGLVRVYQELERFDDAIPVAKMISEKDPEDILAHTSLSMFYQSQGRIEEA